MLRILTVVLSGTILLGTGCANSSEGDDQEAPPQDVAAQRFREASAKPFGCDGERVALKTRNGKNYLTALAGGAFGVAASATAIDRNERFKVYDLGRGRVALQAPNGRYVGWGSNQPRPRDQNGQPQAQAADFLLSANSFSIDQSTVLRVQRVKDSEWLYVRTYDGRYVSPFNGGGSLVSVALPIAGENQQLKAICVDANDRTEDPDWSDQPSDDADWGDESGDPSGSDESDDPWADDAWADSSSTVERQAV